MITLCSTHDIDSLLMMQFLLSLSQDFLPLIAVAYGKAISFSDVSAIEFSLDVLFAPSFGQDLATKTLEKLRARLPGFDRFTDFDDSTNSFIDPTNKTLFRVKDYLPEIQFAFDLSPSVDLASRKFKPSDLQDALFSDPRPTIKSFASFLKKNILDEIKTSLSGLFSTTLDVPAGGLTVSEPSFGADGPSFGEYSNISTRAFPPSVNVDAVDGFAFDLNVDVSESGSLSLEAGFVLNVQGVDPLATVSQIVSALNNTLQSLGGDFLELTSSFGSNFDDAAKLLDQISQKVDLSLAATIDFKVAVDLSLSSFDISSSLNELSASFTARIAEDFKIELGELALGVTPSIYVYLEAENTAVPFDVFNSLDVVANLTAFDFGGTFDARVGVGEFRYFSKWGEVLVMMLFCGSPLFPLSL